MTKLVNSIEQASETAIAVIGMAGRFPRCQDVDELWQRLCAGEDCIDHFAPEKAAAGRVYARGLVSGIDQFAANFFGYSAAEAELLDPQQRLFLECAWQALDDAGAWAGAPFQRAGVFAGASLNTYFLELVYPLARAGRVDAALAYSANHGDQLAMRVAYELNLKGPAVTVQTACSSSLAAVHFAIQSLLTSECDLALAGGVSLLVPQRQGYPFAVGGITSEDGVCRPFSEGANGTVFSDGLGVVVLKRLRDALRDGDRVRAVLLGSAMNNDGRAKVGFTAPSVEGQRAALEEALAVSGVAPSDIAYVEAHGTGTALGDPIEMRALVEAYHLNAPGAPRTAVGSIKGNLGHLDAASGVAGLIKAVLCLEHGLVPPSIHAERCSSALGLSETAAFVPQELAPMPARSTPHRAAVSSFGVGGTNVHVILEQGPDVEVDDERPRGLAQVLTLSAKSAGELERMKADFAEYLTRSRSPLDVIARAARTQRPGLPQRCAAIGKDPDELLAALRGERASGSAQSVATEGPVAFLFTGQGSAFRGVSRQLHGFTQFSEAFEECRSAVARIAGPRLAATLDDEAGSGPSDTVLEQLQSFALAVGLAGQWRAVGVVPSAVVGHSLGEVAAAYVAGALKLDDAVRVVWTRARAMSQLEPGAMLAVGRGLGFVVEHLPAELDIAAVNSPDECVVSGPTLAIERLARDLTEKGVPCQKLNTSFGFHSRTFAQAANALRAELAGLAHDVPRVPLISTVTGELLEDPVPADHWAANVAQRVRFRDALQALQDRKPALLIEIGAGSALLRLARACGFRMGLPSLSGKGGGAADQLLSALAGAWCAGAPVDFEPLYRGRRRALALPPYPAERARYWLAEAPLERRSESRRDEPTLETWTPTWQATPEIDLAAPRDRRAWLLLSDGSELAERLASHLRQLGQRVVVAQDGPRFESAGAGAYTFRRGSAEDLRRLLSELRTLRLAPDHVVYFPKLGAVPADIVGEAAREVDELVLLGRELVQGGTVSLPSLLLASRNACNVTGSEVLRPVQAIFSGSASVLALECGLSVAALDFDEPTTDFDLRQLCLRLLATREDGTLAVRGARLFRREWTRVAVDEARDAEAKASPPVFLVTGGLGGIGATLAHHWVARGSNVVVVHRAVRPGQPGNRLERLAQLRELGPAVSTVEADVTVRAELARAFEIAVERFGSVDVVVHAAAVADHGSVLTRELGASRRVLSPKLGGTLNVLDLAKQFGVRTCVLCSSAVTRFGAPGQVAYAAANAFVEAATAQAWRAREELRVVCVAWDTWRDVGMAVDADVPTTLQTEKERRLSVAIPSDLGCRSLDRALGSPYGHVLFSMPTAAADRGTTEREDAAPVGSVSRHPRPALSSPYRAPETAAQRLLVEAWERALNVAPIGLDDDFFELGGHSLMAAQLLADIREALNADVPLHLLFEGKTIAEFSILLEEEFPEVTHAFR